MSWFPSRDTKQDWLMDQKPFFLNFKKRKIPTGGGCQLYFGNKPGAMKCRKVCPQ
jgi:hypothetical protein